MSPSEHPAPAAAPSKKMRGRLVASLLAGGVLLGGVAWGLHWWQVGRFIESTDDAYLRADSVVVMHDCWPLDERTSRRKRESVLWTGDVWRVVVMLRRHRPDLVVRTLGAPPSGLAVVLNLDPASTLLASRYEAIVSEGMALDYAWLRPSQAEQLALVPGDWSTLRALLDARPARR